MYVVGNTLVAYNVTLNADGFQFRSVGGWEKQVGAYQEYGSATPSQPTIGEWYQSKFSTDGYMSNITVTETSKAYDLYLLNDPDLAYFCIVEAGSAAPATPEVPSVDLKWGICGSFTNWGEKDDIAMTFDGENWVATNVTLPANAEFQFRYRASWNIAQKGLSETKAITIGDVTSVSGTQNIKVATAGTYDIYLTEDLGAFAVVSTGAGFPSTDTYKLYVYNYVGWSKVYLWAWDSSTNYTGSSWPGVQLTEKTTIGGYEYFVFTFPVSANDKAVNIILNAGNGLPQTSDFSLGTINKDYYVRNDGATAALIEDPYSPEPTVEKVARKITVTYTGGGDLYCYSWISNPITGSWPGTKMTKSGTTYTYTFDKSYDGSTVNVIFNNNKGGQTNNITNVTLDKDHSFTLDTEWTYTWSTK